MYPDARVTRLVNENFVPIRVHLRDDADEYKRLGARYGVDWTPTILLLDGDGEERHRIAGFLPVDDFLPQLRLGLAHTAFAGADYGRAETQFRQVVDEHPASDAAAEAQYWAGVARYKGTGDAAALADTARRFQQRYGNTPWAKKASVWAE